MTQCELCDFQILKVPDLITKDGEIHYVSVLKSKKSIHDCVFLPKRTSENVRYFANDLPTVQFLKADNVLKRRFYEICPPIQRKRLWNCSRTCANLGRKPTTLIARENFYRHIVLFGSSAAGLNAFHMIPRMNSIVSTETNQIVMDNFVMDFRYHFNFDFDSKRMAELARFVEFNQTKVQLNNDDDLTSFYPLIFTPKVTHLLLFGKDIFRNLLPIWRLLPNLSHLITDLCIPPSMFKEFTYCPKLSSIYLFIAEHLDYSMIAEFLKIQPSFLWFAFDCSFELDLNEKSLHQHFVPVKEQMWNQKGLCFMTSDDDDQFFVLR